MIAFGAVDATWTAAAAFGAAMATWAAIKFRASCRWVLERAKAGFLGWFSEAVDEHVEPKFERLRHETEVAAAEVKQELRDHTENEAELVRDVVRGEVAPLVTRLDRIEANGSMS